MPVHLWINKVQTIQTIWGKVKGLSALNKPEQRRSSSLDLAVTCLHGVRDGEDRSREWENPHAISRIEISIPLLRHMSGVPELKGSCRGFSLGGWRVIHSATYLDPIPGLSQRPNTQQFIAIPDECCIPQPLHSLLETCMHNTTALWRKQFKSEPTPPSSI